MSFKTSMNSGGPLTKLSLLLLRQEAKRLRWRAKRLAAKNFRSEARVTAPGGPVVSLTTFGPRLESVHITLESIAAGTLLPSRLILWLDDPQRYADRPEAIRRLERRGLEVCLTENYGPHTKYYPYLLAESRFELPLITADDDVIYSRWWLEGLVEAHRDNPNLLNCYRAHVMAIENGGLAPYRSWQSCQSTRPSHWNFATGVSGCMYPTRLQIALRDAGAGFKEQCPKADDVWLNVLALRSGFPVRQIRGFPVRFPLIAGTQESGLWHGNVLGSHNDDQIKRTYTDEDLALLSASRA